MTRFNIGFNPQYQAEPAVSVGDRVALEVDANGFRYLAWVDVYRVDQKSFHGQIHSMFLDSNEMSGTYDFKGQALEFHAEHIFGVKMQIG